jgi:hypothetical protein
MINNLLFKLIRSDILHFMQSMALFGTAQQMRKATTSLVLSVRSSSRTPVHSSVLPSGHIHSFNVKWLCCVTICICIFEQAYKTCIGYYTFDNFHGEFLLRQTYLDAFIDDIKWEVSKCDSFVHHCSQISDNSKGLIIQLSFVIRHLRPIHSFANSKYNWNSKCNTHKLKDPITTIAVTGIFQWHNHACRTMALGSTQPLTEMSTRCISRG